MHEDLQNHPAINVSEEAIQKIIKPAAGTVSKTAKPFLGRWWPLLQFARSPWSKYK
jgi:hypothetical protein